MATSPLTYESHSTHPQSQSALSLPSYTSRATSQHTLHRREHQYTLGSSTGRPWLILSIQSRSPDPNLLPLYYEGDTISGAVSVDLKSGEHIREVLVSLQGQILGAGQDLEPYTFLDITQAIWSQSAGKLNGRHSWSFAITPPREVTVPSPTTPFLPTTYQLPPKFSERGSQAHVDYKILVTVRRRRLSVDSTLFTPCVYLPYSVAIPPSPRRLVAYRNEMLPPGPDADPEGWKILPVVEERVTISGAQRASIQCSLAIAAPLSFAVNSYVPLYAVLRSRHENLVQRAAISVQLVRTLHVADFTATRRGMSFYDVMSEAVFWPASDEHSQMPGTKALRGELPLRKKLTPSFHFSKVSIQYAVVLSAVRSPGFTPAPRDIPLLSEPVQVMLKNPHGVSPRSFAPSNAQMATGASSSYDHHTQQRLERATYVGYPYVGQAA